MILNFKYGACRIIKLHIKDDFQSVLRTLESLFAFFCVCHVSHGKMYSFPNWLEEVNSKFQNNHGCYGCEVVETTSQPTVKINEAVGKGI